MRIRSLTGQLLGAGVLLGDRHVLTCAHVVAPGLPTAAAPGPDAKVLVDLVAQPGSAPVAAAVVPGGWAGMGDDGRGDVALLELERPAAVASDAQLRALSLSWQRAVYTFGFPAGLDDGVYVRAVLAGQAGPGAEWIQMDARDPRLPIRAGFSGSGVVDEETGYVLGIVVSAYSHLPAGLSWMIPTETILAHVRRVADWVTGEPSADPSFFESSDPAADTVVDPAARPRGDPVGGRIADFFGRTAPDNVMTLVTGRFEDPVAAAVRGAVAMSNRSLTGRGTEPVADGSAVPPVGSIDLAVDATGSTPADVARRIVEWAGSSSSAAADVAPHSLLVDRIDRSADPRRLVDDVIGPIAVRATERDMRLLLGFRDPSLGLRLTLLAMRVDELDTVEAAVGERHKAAAKVLADPPGVTPHATDLRMHLAVLRQVADRAGTGTGHRVSARLASYERAVDRALRRAVAARAELDDALARHRELLGRLMAEQALAGLDGLAEDLELGPLFRQAHALLTSGRCDLAEAGRAVERFAHARRRGPRGGRAHGVMGEEATGEQL